jgi:tetratricopeptide (TPR) repeat protein
MTPTLLLTFMLLAQQNPPPVKPVVAPAPTPAPTPAPEAKPADGKPVAGDDEKSPNLTKEQLEARSVAAKALEQFESQKYPKAAELAQAARQLDAAYPLPVKILGWCAVSTGDDAKAAELLTEALNMDLGDAELQFLLARTHLRLKEFGAAKDLLADLVKKHGATPTWLLETANACIGLEDWAAAEAALLQAEKLDGADREIDDTLVDLYERSEQPEKAIEVLRRLIKDHPLEGPLRYRHAHLLTNQQKFEEAASVLEEAARVLPQEAMPHEMLVRLYDGPLPDRQRADFHKNWLKEFKLRRR